MVCWSLSKSFFFPLSFFVNFLFDHFVMYFSLKIYLFQFNLDRVISYQLRKFFTLCLLFIRNSLSRREIELSWWQCLEYSEQLLVLFKCILGLFLNAWYIAECQWQSSIRFSGNLINSHLYQRFNILFIFTVLN